MKIVEISGPELQVTPLPQAFSEGADSARPLQGLAWRAFVLSVGQGLLPWLLPIALIVVWQIASSLGWLARSAPDLAPAERQDLVTAALAVLEDPRWSEVFGPGSLAEVPVAALVGTRLVSGTIDRLLITPDCIRIVDFKTDRRPPDRIEAIAPAYLRQMAAYVAAMAVIHPGRRVEAALLFTATPQLFVLPDNLIAAQKLGLGEEEESFSA